MQKVSILSDFFSGDRKKRCSSVDKFFWFFLRYFAGELLGFWNCHQSPKQEGRRLGITGNARSGVFSSSFAAFIWVVTHRIIRGGLRVTIKITAKQLQSVNRVQRRLQFVQINLVCFAERNTLVAFLKRFNNFCCHPGSRSDYRYPDFIGRQVPVLQQLDSWRHQAIWHHRS